MWTISTLQPGKMGLPPTASLPLSQNKFSHKNKKIDILRIEWVCVWKAEIRKIIIPVKPADTPPALCITELRHVHRRRECSFASRAQPVPPVAPCNPSTPSSPLSISCIPAWGPNAGCHPSLSPPSLSSSPTATLPPPLLIPTQAEGLAVPYIAASAAGWRWEEPSGLQTVSGLETPLWSTPTATWGGNNNAGVTKRSEWLMLSICEIWNKSALLSDPNCGCLCDRKTGGQKPRRRQPQPLLFTMHKSNSHAVLCG